MIKIEITDEIKAAVDLHWKWIAHRFRIREKNDGLTGAVKGAFTRARNKKKELYFLLGYITDNDKKNDSIVDSKDEKFEKLICSNPKEMIKYARESQQNEYQNLILKPPSKYRSYERKKKKIESMDDTEDPKYKELEEEIKNMESLPEIKEFEERKEKGEEIQKLLNYEGLYEDKGLCKEDDWNAYKLCNMVNLSLCPYCNRQYIFTVGKDGKGLVRPQLDHFFVKSIFPYLSCSFFNLIPSCPFCNEGKGDEPKETIYPYLEEFGKNYVFKMDVQDVKDVKKLKNIKPKDIDYSICLDDGNLDVSLDQTFFQAKDVAEFRKLLHASDEVFNLTELYKAHQADLKDLLEKYVNVTGANLDELADKYYKGKGKITDEDKQSLRRILLGLPIKIENADYPLRKFKEDIIDQLDKER